MSTWINESHNEQQMKERLSVKKASHNFASDISLSPRSKSNNTSQYILFKFNINF